MAPEPIAPNEQATTMSVEAIDGEVVLQIPGLNALDGQPAYMRFGVATALKIAQGLNAAAANAHLQRLMKGDTSV